MPWGGCSQPCQVPGGTQGPALGWAAWGRSARRGATLQRGGCWGRGAAQGWGGETWGPPGSERDAFRGVRTPLW